MFAAMRLWLVLFFFSGAAGLGYQTVWTKMFANGLGHEVPAMLSVVSAFMAGMALGAWRIGRQIESPAKLYAFLELVIGLWGIASCWVIPALNAAVIRILGTNPPAALHWAVAFGTVFLGLLPATAAMGATFAVMEQLLARERSIGALYASNTAGAVAGVLIGTFVLMPQLGLRMTAMCLAGINFICAALARRLSVESLARCGFGEPRPGLRLQATVVVTGMFAIGLEVAGVRVLAQVMENTVFTFAAVLSVYLLGTAIGAAIYQRFAPRLWWLLWAGSLACLMAIGVLGHTESIYKHLRSSFPDNLAGGVGAELLCAAMVFLPPTIVFGAIFSQLFQSAKECGLHLGPVYALNCLGSALAPLIFPLALLPIAGAKMTLIIIGLGYLLLLPRFRIAALVPLGLLFFLPKDLRFVQGNVLAYREGRMASVAVVEDALKERTLRVNNRFQMGGTSAHQAEYRQAYLPLLLHPAPRRALFLGAGTAITMAAAKRYSNLEVAGVELVPEVVDMIGYFRPYNDPVQARDVFLADARRFVSAGTNEPDVIVGDLFHPALDGAGTLYTREHFAAIRGRLSANGLFCQWLPLHQLDEAMLRLVMRTFLDVFPNTQAYLLHYNVEVPVLGLVGFVTPPHFSEQWLESRSLPPEVKALALSDSLRLFGHFVGGPRFLQGCAGTGPINTDADVRRTGIFVSEEHLVPRKTLAAVASRRG
jgi:spermidine synthase